MRSLLLVPLLAALAAPAAAQGAQPPPEPRVTVHLQDAPLRSAIHLLFEGTDLPYSIAAGVPDVPISLNARDVPLAAALRGIIRLAVPRIPGLTVAEEGAGFRIYVAESPPAAPPPVPAPVPAEIAAWTLPADADLTVDAGDGPPQRIAAGQLRGGILRLTGPLQLTSSTGLTVEVRRAQAEIDKSDPEQIVIRLRALPPAGR